MCGLTAILNFSYAGIAMKEMDMFRQLLVTSTLRGSDSTGVMYIGDERSGLATKEEDAYVGWFKKVGNAWDLLNSKMWDQYSEDMIKSRFLAGHCRAATRGAAGSSANAHPFEHGHIVLMHNGTINNVDTYSSFKDHANDSEALCYAMAEDGDAAKTLGGIDGAAAIFWYDSNQRTFNVWRNWQRPLYITKIMDSYFIASEEKMLAWILDRNNAGFYSNMVSVPVEKLITWKHNDPDATVTKAERIFPKKPDPVVVNLPPASDQSGHSSTPPWWNRMQDLSAEEEEEISNACAYATGDVVPTKKKEDKRKVFSCANFFGMQKNKEVLFMPMNVEWPDQDRQFAVITGTVYDLLEVERKSLGMLDEVVVTAYIRGKTEDEVSKLYQAELLKGTIQSVVLNPADIGDIKCYVANVGEAKERTIEAETQAV